MKRRIILLFALCAVIALPANVMAEDAKAPPELAVLESPADSHNPSYYMTWDYGEEGELLNEKLLFPGGAEEETDAGYIMLMKDGSFFPNDVIISESAALIPIGVFAEERDADVSWEPETKTASFAFPEGGTLTVQAGSIYATLNGGEIVLDRPAQIVNDRMYVIAAAAAAALGEDCGVYQKNETFARFPILWLSTETVEGAETEAEAAEGAKSALSALLDEVDEKYGTLDGAPVNLGTETVRNNVGSPTVSGEISRYWILCDAEGNDYMLRDKYSGAMFLFRGAYGSYWIEPLTTDSLYYVFFTQ